MDKVMNYMNNFFLYTKHFFIYFTAPDTANHSTVTATVNSSPTVPSATATTNGDHLSDSCAKWSELCDRQASLAADHFFRSVCESNLLLDCGSSSGVTGSQVLERYVATFSNKIRRHLEERKIDLEDNLVDHVTPRWDSLRHQERL
jgi:hypothetical protein